MQTDTKGWDDLSGLEVLPITQQVVTNHNNLLICDGNNIGYRYLKRKNYNNFGDDYIRTVESLAKSYNAREIIVAFDFGKSYYRTSLYEKYKSGRAKPETEDDQKHYEEFFACLNDVADQLPDYIHVVKHRGVEADDIISFMVNNLHTEFDQIWIVSSDRDIYQLLRDNIFIFNLFSRKEIGLSHILEKYKVTPQEYMLSRIISGDSGDTIDGIEGIGEVRGCALASKYKTLDNLIKALPIKGTSQYIKNLNAGKDILIRNETLINLTSYNDIALTSGKEGDIIKEELNAVLTAIHQSKNRKNI